jgi:hypothetical protein
VAVFELVYEGVTQQYWIIGSCMITNKCDSCRSCGQGPEFGGSGGGVGDGPWGRGPSGEVAVRGGICRCVMRSVCGEVGL